MELLLHEIRRDRFLVPVPFFIGDIQATFAGLLPNPPFTRDDMRSLREDNVVAEGSLTLSDLGVSATAAEASGGVASSGQQPATAEEDTFSVMIAVPTLCPA